MKFVFMFVNRIEKILFVHFFKIMKIVRTFRIDTFVDSKMFAVLNVNKGMITVRTFQGIGFQKTVFIRRKRGGADLAEDLSLGTIILIKKRFGSIAARTGTVVTDVTIRTTINGFDLFTIFPFKIRDIVFIVPSFVVNDLRKLIDLEFLIFGRMRIIEGPLSERDISADKI